MATASPPGWLRVLRYAVALLAIALAVSIPITPGLAPWSAPLMIPAAVGYALIVALPVALIVHGLGWAGPIRAMMAGLLAGGGPVALLALLAGSPREAIFYFILSAVGGLGAWLLARLQSITDLWLRGSLAVPAGTTLSLALLAATLSLAEWGSSAIHGPKDLSCHSLGRYEAKSFPVRQIVTIRLGERDWVRLRTVMSEIATRDGWSLRDHTKDGSLGMTLCQEVGTLLTIQQWTWSDPPWPAARLYVVAPQGGEAWRPSIDSVLARLEVEWLDAVDRDPEPGYPHIKPRAVAPAQPSNGSAAFADRVP